MIKQQKTNSAKKKWEKNICGFDLFHPHRSLYFHKQVLVFWIVCLIDYANLVLWSGICLQSVFGCRITIEDVDSLDMPKAGILFY